MRPLPLIRGWSELSQAMEGMRNRELGALHFYGHPAGLDPDYSLSQQHLILDKCPSTQFLLGLMEMDGLLQPIEDHGRATAIALARWELSAEPPMNKPRSRSFELPPDQFYAPMRSQKPSYSQDHLAVNRALAYRYAFGIGVPKSCPRARDLLFTAALPIIQEYLNQHRMSTSRARMLTDPPGHEDTQQEMLEYYGYSADSGDIQSMVVLGQYRYYRGEWSDADGLFSRVISKLDPLTLEMDHADSVNLGHALGYLGQMRWEQGEKAEAYRLFTQGARRKSPMSMAGLGHAYWHGVDMGKEGEENSLHLVADRDAALEWFEKAAELDYAEGHYGVAMILAEQHAILHDDRIQNHLLAAIRKLHIPAVFEMARRHLRSDLTCQMAWFLLKTVHDHDVKAVDAIDGAVEDYHTGRMRLAFSTLLSLAHQGYSVAMINLATLLMEMGGKRGNVSLARRAAVWWSRAGNLEDVRSRVKLADQFYLGEGVPRDPIAAAAHYQRSISQRSTTSAFNLALMYMRGVGVSFDLHWATYMLQVSEYYGKNDGFPEVWLPIAIARFGLECLKARQSFKWSKLRIPVLVVLTLAIIVISTWLLIHRMRRRAAIHPIQMQPLPPTPTATEGETEWEDVAVEITGDTEHGVESDAEVEASQDVPNTEVPHDLQIVNNE